MVKKDKRFLFKNNSSIKSPIVILKCINTQFFSKLCDNLFIGCHIQLLFLLQRFRWSPSVQVGVTSPQVTLVSKKLKLLIGGETWDINFMPLVFFILFLVSTYI